jgi:hypothetical protein
MTDKTLACGEENPTTSPRFEECAAGAPVETENPFGTY